MAGLADRLLVALSILLLLLSHVAVAQDLEVADGDSDAATASGDVDVPIYPEPPKPVDSDPAIPAFLNWLHSKRVNTSAIRIIDTPYGRGLAATRSFRTNATIFSIPHSLLLTTDYVQQESALAEELSELEPTDAFAVWLAHNRRSTKSQFHPYIASLPTFVPLPLFFAPQVSSEYEGTQLEEIANTRRGLAYGAYQRLSHDVKGLATRENFLWSLSQLWSRSFSVAMRDSDAEAPKSRKWRSVAALVPLADMLNTGDSVNVRCRTSKTGTSFQCTALRPIAANEELLVSYGAKTNAQLLHDYGFVLYNNSNDYATITLPSPKHNKTKTDTHKVSFRKMEVEDQWNKEHNNRKQSELTFKLLSNMVMNGSGSLDSLLGVELVGWARLNVIDALDVKRLTAYEMIQSMRSGRSFSHSNDLRAIKLILKQLAVALDGYPTKLSDDWAQLSGEAGEALQRENTPVYWCVLLRWSEKNILATAADKLAVEIVRVEAAAAAEVEERKAEKARQEAEKKAKEEKEKQRKLEKERQRREEDAREAQKRGGQQEEEEEEEEDDSAELDWLDSSRSDMERAMSDGPSIPKHNELR